MTLVRASIGLPDSENCINVTYVGKPGDPREHYVVTFVDTENYHFECDMQQISKETMFVRCSALVSKDLLIKISNSSFVSLFIFWISLVFEFNALQTDMLKYVKFDLNH